MAVSKHCVFNEIGDNFSTHQTYKYANLKYYSKYATKVNNKIPVIIPESDTRCLENVCQICWTTAKSDWPFQKISKIVYFLYFKRIIWRPPFNWKPGLLLNLPCGKQVPVRDSRLFQSLPKRELAQHFFLPEFVHASSQAIERHLLREIIMEYKKSPPSSYRDIL